MKRLQALNLGQRIVLVVALGVVLRAIATYHITRRWAPSAAWFWPGSTFPLARDPGQPLAVALLVIVLTVSWAAASVWLLGLPRKSPDPPA